MSISKTHLIRLKALRYVKGVNFPPPLSPSSSFSQQRFCTNISDSHSFAVSYLINNFGFSLQSASKLCSTYNVRFKTAENPNSVLTFFTNYGFSNTQLHSMIPKAPWLLSCDPSKRVLPKFQFFLSKGASTSDIVKFVCKNPNLLRPSLENLLVPNYELVYRFLQSDKDIIALLNLNPALIANSRMEHNIRLMIENGMADSNIARILRIRSTVFGTDKDDMMKAVEDLKDLGFHPSKSTFAVALIAKVTVSRTLWNDKVNTFKKWGWSDEDVLKAFKSYPHCMLNSVDKINLVMSFWVNQLGWDALALPKRPHVFSFSLERRIIPRATVVQFLFKKGLGKKDASLTGPFRMPEKLFIVRYIKCFKEHSSDLLKVYEEKLNLAYTARENTGIS